MGCTSGAAGALWATARSGENHTITATRAPTAVIFRWSVIAISSTVSRASSAGAPTNSEVAACSHSGPRVHRTERPRRAVLEYRYRQGRISPDRLRIKEFSVQSIRAAGEAESFPPAYKRQRISPWQSRADARVSTRPTGPSSSAPRSNFRRRLNYGLVRTRNSLPPGLVQWRMPSAAPGKFHRRSFRCARELCSYSRLHYSWPAW